MRCEMEVEEIEAILEKIWDLHDQISNAIHLVTRAHFLNSTKAKEKKLHNNQNGFVFMKESQAEKDELGEAKSLNVIREALENLEDQLALYHTVQSHQRVERDCAIAQLEQSRLLLAMKLVDYRGKKHSVIDEALAFVGGVENFIAPDDPKRSLPRKSIECPRSKGSNFLPQMFACSFNYAKRSLNLVTVAGLIGNAALNAVSMIAVLQLHQLAFTSGCAIDAPRVQKNGHPNAECGGRTNTVQKDWLFYWPEADDCLFPPLYSSFLFGPNKSLYMNLSEFPVDQKVLMFLKLSMSSYFHRTFPVDVNPNV